MTTDDTNNGREIGCLVPFAGSNRHESNSILDCRYKTMAMLWILLLVPNALVVPCACAALTLTPPPTWTARSLAGPCHPSSSSSSGERYLRFSISSCAITSTRTHPRIASIDIDIDNDNGTRLHLSKSKAADSNENDDKQEKGRGNFAENVVEGAGGIASRVGRLGSRVVGNVLKKGKDANDDTGDDDGDDDDDDDDDDDGEKQGDKMSSTKNLFRRFVKSKPGGINDNERGQDDKASKGNQDKNIFGFENALDSEVALGAALKRQNELQNDQTIIASSEKIVESTPSESGFIKAIASIEESLSSIRNQLSSVRFNEDDESNELLLTRKQEEKRLNQIRRDLENRRKQLILDEQKKKKEMAAQLAEKKKQQRIAAQAAKREREEKMEQERQRKEKFDRQKQIFDNAIKNGGIGPGNIGKSIRAKKDKAPKSEEKNPLKRAGITGIDGLFTGAQSAISNAWDSVFKNDGKDGEWIPVCPKTRISPGEIVPVVAGGVDLLIVASPDGKKVHCIANSCAHLGTPLETGRLERRPIETSRSATEPYNNLDTRGLAASSKAASNKGDGCEVCIVCPLHETAFALESGEVRGEWCPYPPVIGKMMGAAKPESKLPTFAIRTNGKNIEVRMSSSLETPGDSKRKRRGQ